MEEIESFATNVKDSPESRAKRLRSNQQRLEAREILSLIGIINGIVCDGELAETEIIYLKNWLLEHDAARNSWPGSAVLRCVDEVLEDGVITFEEKNRLLQVLKDLSGNDFVGSGSTLPEAVGEIYHNPEVIFPQKVFVLTGTFLFGTQPVCERVTLARGGLVESSITRRTNYIVVGARSSSEWLAENFGRKIQRAMELNDSGKAQIQFITEEHWFNAL